MRNRYLVSAINSFSFSKHKIAMVSGPRQCGKTTLAKMMLKKRGVGAYHNWDEAEFRRVWTKKPSALIPPAHRGVVPLVVLDEIHKDRLWKRNLKGMYDTLESPCDFLVTGSARLNVYRRGRTVSWEGFFTSAYIRSAYARWNGKTFLGRTKCWNPFLAVLPGKTVKARITWPRF